MTHRIMLVTVTDKVTEAMTRAEALRVKYAATIVSDAASYEPITDALETLAVALLGAVSSSPLRGPATVCPKVDMGPGSRLSYNVTGVVRYLKDTATELLGDGGHLSHYETANANAALALLVDLFNEVMASVVKNAEADLAAVSRNLTETLAAARVLAVSAAKCRREGD